MLCLPVCLSAIRSDAVSDRHIVVDAHVRLGLNSWLGWIYLSYVVNWTGLSLCPSLLVCTYFIFYTNTIYIPIGIEVELLPTYLSFYPGDDTPSQNIA